VSHPPYGEISSRKREVHFSEAPLNLVLSGIAGSTRNWWGGNGSLTHSFFVAIAELHRFAPQSRVTR
jgi:hypothetical protein